MTTTVKEIFNEGSAMYGKTFYHENKVYIPIDKCLNHIQQAGCKPCFNVQDSNIEWISENTIVTLVYA